MSRDKCACENECGGGLSPVVVHRMYDSFRRNRLMVYLQYHKPNGAKGCLETIRQTAMLQDRRGMRDKLR